MRYLLLVLASTLSFVGCTDDPLLPGHNPIVVAKHLPPLTATYFYELWINRPPAAPRASGTPHEDDSYISIGKFIVQDDGSMLGLDGNPAAFVIPADVDPGLLADALLTIQNEGDAPGVPGPRLLAGDFLGSETRAYDTLRLTGREAFGDSLGRLYSWCVLDAPTSDAPDDSVRGVWFVNMERDPITDVVTDTLPGLALAKLPTNTDNADWDYQTWLIRYASGRVAEYVPLGRFRNPAMADSNGAGDGAGDAPGRHYQVPGEDFARGLIRTLNDGNYGIVVTLEPSGSQFTRPGVPILSRHLIDNNVPPRRNIELAPVTDRPFVIITLDR